MDPSDLFTHILPGCLTDSEAIATQASYWQRNHLILIIRIYIPVVTVLTLEQPWDPFKKDAMAPILKSHIFPRETAKLFCFMHFTCSYTAATWNVCHILNPGKRCTIPRFREVARYHEGTGVAFRDRIFVMILRVSLVKKMRVIR